MYEIQGRFLLESADHIMQQSETDVKVELGFSDTDMDRAILEFRDKNLYVSIARLYTSEERFSMYIVNYFQGVMPYLLRLMEDFPNLRGRVSLWLDDISRGPGLGFTEGVLPDQFALPDPMFLRSAGYQDIRKFYPSRWTAWRERSHVIFWRGATTGHKSPQRPTWRDLPRARLCLAVANARDTSLFDVGINKIVQIDEPAEIESIMKSGLMRETVPQEETRKYRHSIDIDGNANSWPGLFCKFLLQNTVLKITSAHGYRQWYYRHLVPWEHFIPIDADMESLEDLAVWTLRHPDKSFYIASSAFEFARALTVEQSIRDLGPRLQQYLERSDRAVP